MKKYNNNWFYAAHPLPLIILYLLTPQNLVNVTSGNLMGLSAVILRILFK